MAEVLKNDGSTPPTKTGSADIRKVVETANAEDENPTEDSDDTDDDDDKDDDASSEGTDDEDDTEDTDDNSDTDDGEEDDSDDDSDDDSETDDQAKDRRFTQFAGDGSDETYISNLEKGYQNSSQEAIRLNQELGQATGRVDAIMKAAANDPELATKLNEVLNGSSDTGGSGDDGNSGDTDLDAQNPFVRNLQSEWQEKSQKEIDAFIDANPEVATDPTIKSDVQHWMEVFSNEHFKKTGRLMSGGEAMSAAYKHLGLENKLEKQNLADGAKKKAAPARQRSKSKKSSGQKPAFTEAQIAMAKSMGKDEAWLQKNAK